MAQWIKMQYELGMMLKAPEIDGAAAVSAATGVDNSSVRIFASCNGQQVAATQAWAAKEDFIVAQTARIIRSTTPTAESIDTTTIFLII